MHRLTQNPLRHCIRSTRLRAAGITLALSAAFFASQMLTGGQAFAQEACGDQTCPKGYTCETSQGACDLSCRVPESGEGCEPTPCDAQDYQYCAPAPCSADADCGQGMKCAEHESYDCPTSTLIDPACPADSDCDARVAPDQPESSCTSTPVKMCTPRWQLPCATASDCGPGFTCDEMERCSSAGCSGSRDDAACAAEVERTCESSGTFYCAVVETACTSDASCEAGWTCRDNPSGVCTSSSNGQTSCTPADPPKLCTPPYTDLPGGGGRAALAENTGAVVDTDSREEGSVNGNDAAASTGGGCSINAAPTKTSGAGFSLVGMAAAWALLRRRPRR